MKNLLPILLFACLMGCSQSSVPKGAVVVEKQSPAIGNNKLTESIGIETLGGVFTPLMEAGSSVPHTRTEIFSTAADNQDQIMIKLYRGNQRLAKDNVKIGHYQIQGIPPKPRGTPQIEVSFIISDEDILLQATYLESNQIMNIVEIE